MKKSILSIFIIFLTLIAFISCEHDFLNPADPGSENYQGYQVYDDGEVPEDAYLEMTGINPSDKGATLDNTPLLEWDDISGAASYILRISSTEDGLATSTEILVEASKYQYPFELTSYNETVWWQVAIINESGAHSAWSKPLHFSYNVAEWSGRYPLNGGEVTISTPTFSWDALEGSVGYDIQIADTEQSLTSATIISIDTNSYTPSIKLSNIQNYYWRLRAKNSDGVYTDWGSVLDFSTDLLEIFLEHNLKTNYDHAGNAYAIDFDGDNDIDILGTAGGTVDIINWWENDGNESFTEHVVSAYNVSSAYAVDIDGDSDIDVIGASWENDRIDWWENDGNESFTEHNIVNDFNGAVDVYVVDLNGDNYNDIIGAASDAGEMSWWENDGNESFTKHIIDDTFSYARSPYAIDIDGDYDIDVLGASSGTNTISWWENDGNESFTPHVIDNDFTFALSVYAIDIDSDNDIDILGSAANAFEIAWWENDGNESFTKHVIDDSFIGARAIYAIDMDRDNDIDVLGTANSDNDICWWENDGNESFTKHSIDGNFGGASSVYAIDIDEDNDIDVFGTANTGDKITWWEQTY